jgi:hypothetical protein
VAVGPGEDEFWVAEGDGMFFGASDFVDAVNDGFGNGEFSETSTGNLFTSGEREKMITALEIACRVEGDSMVSAGKFGVGDFAFIMDFAVGANGNTTVCGEIDGVTGDEGAGAHDTGNAAPMGEVVEPGHCVGNEGFFE